MKTLITLTLFLIFFPTLSNGQLKKEADYVDEYSKDYKVFTNSDNILIVAQYFSAEEKSYYFKLTVLDKELTPIFDRKVLLLVNKIRLGILRKIMLLQFIVKIN